MEIIKKIIGLIIIIAIVFVLINSRKFLPSINNLALGNSKVLTPFQIGTSYVDQIEQMSPKVNSSYREHSSALGYGSFSNAYTYNGSKRNSQVKGVVTIEKIQGQLHLSVENIQAPAKSNMRYWLTNRPNISDQTEYVDFGKVESTSGVLTYTVNLHNADIDMTVFKYLMIVDPQTYTVYSVAVLGK